MFREIIFPFSFQFFPFLLGLQNSKNVSNTLFSHSFCLNRCLLFLFHSRWMVTLETGHLARAESEDLFVYSAWVTPVEACLLLQDNGRQASAPRAGR